MFVLIVVTFEAMAPYNDDTLASIEPFIVATLAVILELITELADVALAVIEPFIVATLPEISPRKVATLAEILVLITELADAALAVISPLRVATLVEIAPSTYSFMFAFAVSVYEFAPAVPAFALSNAACATVITLMPESKSESPRMAPFAPIPPLTTNAPVEFDTDAVPPFSTRPCLRTNRAASA